MNFWYHDMGKTDPIGEHNFRKSKRWNRLIQETRSVINKSLRPDIQQNSFHRIQELSPEFQERYPNLTQFFTEAPRYDNFTYFVISCLIIYPLIQTSFFWEDFNDAQKHPVTLQETMDWLTAKVPEEVLSIPEYPPEQTLTSQEQDTLGKSAMEYLTTYFCQVTNLLEHHLGTVLARIDKNFAEACYRRLSILTSYDPTITTENYYRRFLPKEYSSLEIPGILEQLTLEYTIEDIAELRINYYTEDIKSQWISQHNQTVQRQLQAQDQQIQDLTTQLTDVQQQLAHAQHQLRTSQESIQHQTATLRRNYKAKLADSKAEQAQLKQSLQKLEHQQKLQRHSSGGSLSSLPLPAKKQKPLKVDHSLHYVFIIDGDGPVLTQIKQNYPNALCISGTNKLKSLSPEVAPIVILAIKFSHHNSVLKYRDLCKTRGIPFYWWNSTNLTLLDQAIAKYVPSAILPEET